MTITFAYFNLPENVIPFTVSHKTFNIVLGTAILLALFINFAMRSSQLKENIVSKVRDVLPRKAYSLWFELRKRTTWNQKAMDSEKATTGADLDNGFRYV